MSKKEWEIKYMQTKVWGWGCSPSADDPAAKCAQNFINRAPLWDYFYQFHLPSFRLRHSIPTLSSVWHIQQGIGSSRASLKLLSNEGKSWELWHSYHGRGGQAESLEEGRLISRAEGVFQGQQLLSYPPPLHTALVLPQSALLSLPSPRIAGKMDSPGLGTGGGGGWPCRHPSGTPADGRCKQLCPSVLPHRLGQLQPKGTCGHVPKTQQWPQKGAASVASRAMGLHDLSVKSSALPTLGSSMNTTDIFQPCTPTIYRHRSFTSLPLKFYYSHSTEEGEISLRYFRDPNNCIKPCFHFLEEE